LSTFFIILLVLSSLTLITSILMSQPSTGGMGAIEGGAQSLFGNKRKQGKEAMLANITKVSAIVFMLSAFLCNLV